MNVAKIFISYRRDDESIGTDRLFEALKKKFGKRQILQDAESLKPGKDFTSQLERIVSRAHVMLVVIGKNWAAHSTGIESNVESPIDYVTWEIAQGLNRDIPVIPILLDGASMPSAKELPETIKPFARYQAFEISRRRWERDVDDLLKLLDDMTGGQWKRGLGYAASAPAGYAGFTALNLGVLANLSLGGAAGFFLPPVMLIGGTAAAGYLAYKGTKRLLNKV